MGNANSNSAGPRLSQTDVEPSNVLLKLHPSTDMPVGRDVPALSPRSVQRFSDPTRPRVVIKGAETAPEDEKGDTVAGEEKEDREDSSSSEEREEQETQAAGRKTKEVSQQQPLEDEDVVSPTASTSCSSPRRTSSQEGGSSSAPPAYPASLQKILERTGYDEQTSGRPRVLLHSCCAPCSGAMVETMHEDFQLAVTVFFYNPNIHPREEYMIRKEENKRFCASKNIPFVDCDYDAESFFKRTKGLEMEPERGIRCSACFDMRMEYGVYCAYSSQKVFPCYASDPLTENVRTS